MNKKSAYKKRASKQKGGKSVPVRHDAPPQPISPGSFWLVLYEHRPAVITIAPDRSGFFACGQEPCWPLNEVQAWIRPIKVVDVSGHRDDCWDKAHPPSSAVADDVEAARRLKQAVKEIVRKFLRKDNIWLRTNRGAQELLEREATEILSEHGFSSPVGGVASPEKELIALLCETLRSAQSCIPITWTGIHATIYNTLQAASPVSSVEQDEAAP